GDKRGDAETKRHEAVDQSDRDGSSQCDQKARKQAEAPTAHGEREKVGCERAHAGEREVELAGNHQDACADREDRYDRNLLRQDGEITLAEEVQLVRGKQRRYCETKNEQAVEDSD